MKRDQGRGLNSEEYEPVKSQKSRKKKDRLSEHGLVKPREERASRRRGQLVILQRASAGKSWSDLV